jgi:hypothetical protein
MSFCYEEEKKINLRRVCIIINIKMNRAPTTVSVGPVRSQHGSGVRKRKYKLRKNVKRKRKVGRKPKTNVRGRRAIGMLLKRILKG